MPVNKTVFMDKWIKVEYESFRSHNVYEIDCHWEVNVKKWKALICTCKGFRHRSTCSHLALAEEELKGIPAPTDNLNVKLKKEFWFKCGLCDSSEFMVRDSGGGKLQILCSQCGRMYEVDD